MANITNKLVKRPIKTTIKIVIAIVTLLIFLGSTCFLFNLSRIHTGTRITVKEEISVQKQNVNAVIIPNSMLKAYSINKSAGIPSKIIKLRFGDRNRPS